MFEMMLQRLDLESYFPLIQWYTKQRLSETHDIGVSNKTPAYLNLNSKT